MQILFCTADGVEFANATAVAAFRARRREDLQGIDPGILICESDHQRVLAALKVQRHHADGELPERIECQLKRLDGTIFDAEMTVASIRHKNRPATQVFIRDITDRKLAERQHRLAAAVFETTDEAMMVTDAVNRIVAVNPAFERVTGYAEDEIIGHNPHDLSSGRHDQTFYDAQWAVLQIDGPLARRSVEPPQER